MDCQAARCLSANRRVLLQGPDPCAANGGNEVNAGSKTPVGSGISLFRMSALTQNSSFGA
jgi:hypothetical protein